MLRGAIHPFDPFDQVTDVKESCLARVDGEGVDPEFVAESPDLPVLRVGDPSRPYAGERDAT
jgi:hypothetical protein